MTPYLRLFVMLALMLLLPALVFRHSVARTKFDMAPLQELRQKRPDYVLIGDSMLGTRVDAKLLERELGGETATLLWDNGAASARWYLQFKNYVVASHTRPKRVIFYFRDRFWSRPTHRTEGMYRRRLEATLQADEPVFHRLARSPGDTTTALRKTAADLWPVIDRRSDAARRLNQLTRVPFEVRGAAPLSTVSSSLFSLHNLRGDLADDLGGEDSLEMPVFDASPERSFLPHVLRLAQEHRLALQFRRVKRRPDEHGVREQDPQLRAYIRSLRAHIEAAGQTFEDETEDATIPYAWYGDGDHLSESGKQHYTRWLARRLCPQLPPGKAVGP